MLYFFLQTLFLSLLVFIGGLFIGIFFKNLLCKQRQQIASSYGLLKSKARRNVTRRMKQESASVSFYQVRPCDSAAIAKKRTAALVRPRDTIDRVITGG